MHLTANEKITIIVCSILAIISPIICFAVTGGLYVRELTLYTETYEMVLNSTGFLASNICLMVIITAMVAMLIALSPKEKTSLALT